MIERVKPEKPPVEVVYTEDDPLWLGSFYGSHLTFMEAEALTLWRIPQVERTGEALLMESKWFDYRRLHPLVATYHFAHCYQEAYRHYIRVGTDSIKALYVLAFKGMDFIRHREVLAVWRLRQLADQHGIRYDWLCRQAMDWCLERCWPHPPRPSQIHTNVEMIADLIIAWEKEQTIRVQRPADPPYRVENWTAAPRQRAWEAHAVMVVRNRVNWQLAMQALVFQDRLLRVERALQEFDHAHIERSLELTSRQAIISQR